MQPQPTSVILLAEARHAELQIEAARLRLIRHTGTTRFPTARLIPGGGNRLGITLAGAGVLLHGGLASLHARQRTTAL